MSLAPLRNAAIFSVVTLGTAFAISLNGIKPSKTSRIADAMRRDLDSYNANAGEDQYSNVMLFDRKGIMEDVKDKKPWNKSYADKELAQRNH